MKQHATIYCVEDDSNIRDLVVYALGAGGYDATGFGEAAEFYRALQDKIPDLVILDIMLPGEDGLSILARLRASAGTKRIPVIMLTAKSAEFDKVTGLNSGADDYMTKPFGIMELIARVGAQLRRAGGDVVPLRSYSIGAIRLDNAAHTVSSGGTPVSLTHKEFQLLEYLMQNEGIVLTRDQLLSSVWGFDYSGESRTVDVHIRTLRRKLGSAGQQIETVRGVGYRIGGSE